MCADTGEGLPGAVSQPPWSAHIKAMTEQADNNDPSAVDGLEALLIGMRQSAKEDRLTSPSYQAMETSSTVGQLVRRLEHETTSVILDAYDVLTAKLGLEDKRPLYDYLFEVPMRFRLYREAFNAETHVGCVDRAVTKIAEEIQTAGDPQAAKSDPRFAKAGLAGDGHDGAIGPVAAGDALILADQFDDSRRIQRMSCDTRAIVERILESGADVDPAKLAGTVRLILGTAVDIAHEKDGLETS